MAVGVYQPHAMAGYTYRPGYFDEVLRVNRFGLRGREPQRPGIALVGDSIVAAQEIEWPLTAAAILEDQAGVEVVMIAVAGWSPQSQLGFIEQYGVLGASSAILVLNRGDIWAADITGPPVAAGSIISRIARRLMRRSLRTDEIRKICDLIGRLAIVYHLSKGETRVPIELERLAVDQGVSLHIVAYPDEAYYDHVHVNELGQSLLGKVLIDAYKAVQQFEANSGLLCSPP